MDYCYCGKPARIDLDHGDVTVCDECHAKRQASIATIEIDAVHGIEDTDRDGVYRYYCHTCEKDFRESASSVAKPAICHKCYFGDARWPNPPSDKGRRVIRKGTPMS